MYLMVQFSIQYGISLSKVYHFCVRKILGIEGEHTVTDVLVSEIADIDCRPGFVLAHSDLCRLIGTLINCDIHFRYGTFRIGCEMNDIFAT